MAENNSEEIKMLKNEIKRLTDENKNIKSRNTSLKDRKRNMERANAELTAVMKDLIEENKNLKEEDQIHKDVVEELRNKNLMLRNENHMLRTQSQGLKNESQGLNQENQELKDENQELKDENERQKKMFQLCVFMMGEKFKDTDFQNERMKGENAEGRKENMDADSQELSKLQQNLKSNNVYGHLHQELKDLVETAHQIHMICFDKIKYCYEQIHKEITLPIDIEMVAKTLGIGLEYDNLNLTEQKRIDQNIAQLHYEVSGDTVKKKILVDNSTRSNKSESLSNLEKYAVAYELGKIIIGNEEEIKPRRVRKMNLESRPYSLPRLSARLENFEYEMCAIFLLLPMELFFKEFQNYLHKIDDHPVLMDMWIEHLSTKADIPNYQLINGYQYIKFSAYRYFAMHLSTKEVDGIDYRELYNV